MVANRRSEEVVDPNLERRPSTKELKRALLTALRCIDLNAEKRPSMDQVVRMLDSNEPIPQEVWIYPFYLMYNFHSTDLLVREGVAGGWQPWRVSWCGYGDSKVYCCVFYLVFRTKVTLVIGFSGKKTPTEPSPWDFRNWTIEGQEQQWQEWCPWAWSKATST